MQRRDKCTDMDVRALLFVSETCTAFAKTVTAVLTLLPLRLKFSKKMLFCFPACSGFGTSVRHANHCFLKRLFQKESLFNGQVTSALSLTVCSPLVIACKDAIKGSQDLQIKPQTQCQLLSATRSQ